ncbi:MAG: GDP-mannose 4,6-dehydratase [Candidatus Schekmanbacteria bacterium]|nr:GDP-mannose 4,6-dehydratase [Candidatus Schekmanbacteria bacterium]
MKNEAWAGKKVMITGGLGFIGSNLAHRLVELGADVLLVDAMVPGFGGNYFNIQDIIDKVKINYCDTRDHYSMKCLVRDKEVIFHLAGSFNHIRTVNDPWTDLEINCRGSLSLLEACRNQNPDVKVIYAGHRGQYGRVEKTPINEEQVCHPLQINAVNIMAAEHYHILYNNVHEIKTACLRLTNTYGPRHQMQHFEQGVINWFIHLVLENRVVPLFGDGTQVRDLSYVDDVVEALLLAALSDETNGQVYNLGGEPTSLLDLAKLLIEITGKGGYNLMEYPDQYKLFEVGDYIADYSKIKQSLGWEPKVSLREGMSRTLDFYTKYRKHYWT